MSEYVNRAGIEIDPKLAAFLESEVLNPLGRDIDAFWQGFSALLGSFAPRNRALLATRDELQAKIDGKVSATDVDPAIVKLNKDLGEARTELDRASAAASESWAELQGGVRDSFDKLPVAGAAPSAG